MTRRSSLFLLTAFVLLAHGFLLTRVVTRETPVSVTPPPQAFVTRSIPAPAALHAPVAAGESPAPPKAAAKKQTTRRPSIRKPAPRRIFTAATAAAEQAPPAKPHTTLQEDLAAILAKRGFVADAASGVASAVVPAVAPAPESLLQAAAASDVPTNDSAESHSTAASTPTAAPTAQTATPHLAETSASTAATEKNPAKFAATAPVLPPASRRLGFDVSGKSKGFSYSARAQLLWQHDGKEYHAHQEIKVIFLGSRSQDSAGRLTPQGLEPQRFVDKAKEERSASFDYAQGQVTFSGGAPAAPIQPGAQDRLSVFLQLASLLAGAPAQYTKGSEISMTTVSARGADVWTFTVQGEETLDLPLGQTPALQLQRLPRRANDQQAQVWLAPGLGYLPGRIRVTEPNGDFVQLDLRSEEVP